VGDFQSGPDEDQAAREREETKRLLYVALTRARDRLYLSAVTNDGCLQPGRGSLAEVLPSSLLAQLVPVTDAPIRWKASSGAVHVLRVCEPRAAEGAPLDAVWEQPSAEIEPSHKPEVHPRALGIVISCSDKKQRLQLERQRPGERLIPSRPHFPLITPVRVFARILMLAGQ